MRLSRGKLLGYNFDLQTVEFTMFDGPTGVRCAVEAAAMDDFEEPLDLPRFGGQLRA